MLTYSSPCFIPKNWRKWRCKWAVRTKIMKVGIAGWWWGGGNHVPNATHVLSRDENKGTHTRYNRKPGIIQYSGLTWDMCSRKVSQSVTNYKLLITMPCDWDTLVKRKSSDGCSFWFRLHAAATQKMQKLNESQNAFDLNLSEGSSVFGVAECERKR